MLKSLRVCFLITTCFLLAACGFQLRGADYLPPQLKTVSIHSSSSPYGTLPLNLQRVLASSGIRVTSTAPYTLDITQDNFGYSTTSISSSASPRSYSLVYTVTYALTDRRGHRLVGPLSVASTRSYTLPAGEVFETSSEINVIREEMQRDVIRQLLNTLAARNTRLALAQPRMHSGRR